MAWQISPAPEQFEEALKFFGSRVVMTADFAVDLDAKARTEAFWIGTGLQIHEVDSVFQAIEKAIDSGESFADFKKRLTVDLDERHAETVFRNATQRAYNAGRYFQMRDPDMLRMRPYWMFDAVLDSATTAICQDANGTVLPATHPWWDNNICPRHHRCRSSIRSLRKSDAERRGISQDGPTDAAPGFGAAPSTKAELAKLKPDPKKVDPELVDITNKKATKPRAKKILPPAPKPGPAPKKAPKPKKEAKPKPLQKPKANYDPEHWTRHYREQYGEAAECVGWGRAMYERGLDRPLSELAEQARRLANEGHPVFSDRGFALRATVLEDMAKTLGPRATLRGSAAVNRDQNGWASVLGQLEHSRNINRAAFPIDPINDHAKGAKAFYESMLDASVKRPVGYTQHVGTIQSGNYIEPIDRSYHSADRKAIALSVKSEAPTYVHEWAHAIEQVDRRALERSFQFHEARTKGDPETKLSELFPDRGYEASETAKPDKYWHFYQGKTYGVRYWDGENWIDGRSNTEMTAMGYQTMVDKYEISQQDQETTWFMLGQLAGR